MLEKRNNNKLICTDVVSWLDSKIYENIIIKFSKLVNLGAVAKS